MNIDRRAFIASVGGTAAFGALDANAKADALEDYLNRRLVAGNESGGSAASVTGPAAPNEKYPTVAELEERIETMPTRRGVGNLFAARTGNVKRLAAMPEKPTLIDFFKLRFMQTSNHCLQSANRAMKTGMSEDVILACLLHDVVQEMIKVDHGWWGAQLFEPYVSERTTFAIRYHQALRFYADSANGYEYPALYRRIFGDDYKPEPYIEAAYRKVRKHKWYMEPRMVTVNDLYAFDPNTRVDLDQFTDLIGRRFKQPKEGLGFDGSPVAHMWRSIIRPDAPL
jgi:hypothetical protein